MKDDLDSLIMTAIVFGLVSITFYFIVLKPIQPAYQPGGRRVNQGGNLQQGIVVGGGDFRSNRANNRNGGGGAAASAADNDADGIDGILSKCASFPTHLAPGSQSSANIGGSNLLVDGVLAFRHGKASNYESSNIEDKDIIALNRKDRARILSRLLNLDCSAGRGNNSSSNTSSASSTTAPPTRGSTIILSIPKDDVTCSKLKRILFLLATYYNLLVIIAIPSETKMEDFPKIVQQLRDDDNVEGEEEKKELLALGEEILPEHRIVAASTISGRVAFVRQLGRTELVLDFDAEVKSQLTRFGYKVIQYGNEKSDRSINGSLLGNALNC